MTIDIDMTALADAVDDAVTAAGSRPAVGDTVIFWNLSFPVTYAGPDPHGSEVLSDGVRGSRIYCEPERVAPADAPLPDKSDPRLQIRKSKRPFTYLPGDWCLSLPKGRTSWHKTKRDATEAGLRRLAIVDWHAAQNAAMKDNGGN